MRNRCSLNNILNRDRKVLYIVLSIVLISVLTLTVVYAALSTTLNINGNAEITASSWNIHFDNIKINSGSVEATKSPTIIDSKTIDFTVSLKEPGDYYKFTVDIVNEGTIDAMIDSVVKTPELSATQAKYIKYEIEYTDGNSINNKQLLSKKTTKTISVLVAYRSDVASSDIPTTGESLNLSFTMIYTQADETGNEIPESTPLVRVISGNTETIGSEIAIGDEHFYVISNTKDSITMLAKYNLLVGNYCTSSTICTPYGEEATGIQDSTAIAAMFDSNSQPINFPWFGTVSFSPTNYWGTTTSNYPSYVYNSNSILYEYIENYKSYLEKIGCLVKEARLLSYEEIVGLGCPNNGGYCSSSTPSWLYSTSTWTGSAVKSDRIWVLFSDGDFNKGGHYNATVVGVRPVITISKSEF